MNQNKVSLENKEKEKESEFAWNQSLGCRKWWLRKGRVGSAVQEEKNENVRERREHWWLFSSKKPYRLWKNKKALSLPFAMCNFLGLLGPPPLVWAVTHVRCDCGHYHCTINLWRAGWRIVETLYSALHCCFRAHIIGVINTWVFLFGPLTMKRYMTQQHFSVFKFHMPTLVVFNFFFVRTLFFVRTF